MLDLGKLMKLCNCFPPSPFTLKIKEKQLEESEETLQSLKTSLKAAKTRHSHYKGLIDRGYSGFEIAGLALTARSNVYTYVSNVFDVCSAAGNMAPQVGSPFAITFGGQQVGASLAAKAKATNTIATLYSQLASLMSTLGSYERRKEDWTLQRNVAECDIDQIQRQINGAFIRKEVARKEIEITKKQIQTNESINTFMTSKFTNQQLYRWMAGKLSALYYQTYQMALDLAKGAEKSLQFELGLKESEASYITSYYWDSQKKGLLAGEILQTDLDRMEKAYMDKNRRRFEISKTVSLAEIDPVALLELKGKKACEFSLNEHLFDYDFPGHYRRQIKAISLTFPAVAGPYENINATLTQLSHHMLIEPDKKGLMHLLDPEPGSNPPLSIRSGWRSNQQIALSRGVNDAGLFQLNFQDERYLPFEGTGVVSTWRLELNGYTGAIDYNSLSDVIIKVEYTSVQGGETFANTVKKSL